MKIYNVIKKEYVQFPIFGMIVACGVFICLVSFILSSCNHGSAVSTPSGQIYAWEESVTLNAKEELLKENIDTFFQHKVQRAGLNGCVLVAAEGKILYRNCFGYGNYAAKSKLSDSSVFQLASVSKPFTATAVLLLSERGQLKLDEPVSTYLDAFPYPAITVRMLLNHRSGLMNYIYLFDTLKHQAKWYSNQDVVKYFAQQKPPLQARPNSKFQYCNTNYALLASIVEKVSGRKFSEFISENIFIPCHMYHSRARSAADSTVVSNLALSYMGTKWERIGEVPYDGVMGDKGIFTTTYDLYLFDQALNHGLLLHEETLAEAYKGYSYEKPGQKNYGLGWRIREFPDSSSLIYHNGWWRGYNTLFVRKPAEGICIIVLANKYNRSVYDVKPLFDLLTTSGGELTEGEDRIAGK